MLYREVPASFLIRGKSVIGQGHSCVLQGVANEFETRLLDSEVKHRSAALFSPFATVAAPSAVAVFIFSAHAVVVMISHAHTNRFEF